MTQVEMKAPADFERRILLAVAGTTPQILTETLYALIHATPPFVPTEVHVVTTSQGAERIKLQLLDRQNGKFHAFCRDFGLEGKIDFRLDKVHVLQGSQGPLADIVSPQDNEYAADQIVEWLRGFTQDADCAVHACLAGGRKTMGFYLGYGLSLYGRAQDRLSHVLVTPEFEAHRNFFYIPPEPETLFVSHMLGNKVDERPVSTENAQIWLAHIPFVSLRNGLPLRLLEGKSSYTEAVEVLQASLPDNMLVLDIARRTLVCGGVEVKLAPRIFAFYLWHVRRRVLLEGDVAVSWKDTLGAGNPLMREYFSTYLEVLKGDAMHPDYMEAERAFANGFEKDAWQGSLHHVKRAIQRLLGTSRAAPYVLKGRRVDKSSRLMAHALEFPAERIKLV